MENQQDVIANLFSHCIRTLSIDFRRNLVPQPQTHTPSIESIHKSSLGHLFSGY